jgi:zinc/manganese transport system ATP-binding protein
MAALVFDNLTLGYDRHPAVHHLTGRIEAGALLAVCGPNGAGKSTLLKGIMGQLRPIGGVVRREGFGAREIGYLPQAADVDRSFPISAADFAAMGLVGARGLFGGFGRDAPARIGAALAAVGLSGFETRAIGTLSGGQMQRMLFARLMLQDARLILLDEPFTAIDAQYDRRFLALVARWNARRAHHYRGAARFRAGARGIFRKRCCWRARTIAWGPTRETLSEANLVAARRMVEAFDADAGDCERAA